MNQYIQKKQGEFNKTVDFFKKDIVGLRTGRANPSILDDVIVEAYGVKTPVNGLASVTIADAKSIVVAPWDKNVLKDIEKAITQADFGLSITNEGDKIRLIAPIMTEENRCEIVKKLNKKMEDSRISIRQIREEIKNDIEAAEENKAISEDDKFRFIKELDEEVSKFNELLKELRNNKEKEVMTI